MSYHVERESQVREGLIFESPRSKWRFCIICEFAMKSESADAGLSQSWLDTFHHFHCWFLGFHDKKVWVPWEYDSTLLLKTHGIRNEGFQLSIRPSSSSILFFYYSAFLDILLNFTLSRSSWFFLLIYTGASRYLIQWKQEIKKTLPNFFTVSKWNLYVLDKDVFTVRVKWNGCNEDEHSSISSPFWLICSIISNKAEF